MGRPTWITFLAFLIAGLLLVDQMPIAIGLSCHSCFHETSKKVGCEMKPCDNSNDQATFFKSVEAELMGVMKEMSHRADIEAGIDPEETAAKDAEEEKEAAQAVTEAVAEAMADPNRKLICVKGKVSFPVTDVGPKEFDVGFCSMADIQPRVEPYKDPKEISPEWAKKLSGLTIELYACDEKVGIGANCGEHGRVTKDASGKTSGGDAVLKSSGVLAVMLILLAGGGAKLYL